MLASLQRLEHLDESDMTTIERCRFHAGIWGLPNRDMLRESRSPLNALGPLTQNVHSFNVQ